MRGKKRAHRRALRWAWMCAIAVSCRMRSRLVDSIQGQELVLRGYK
jgi:hypothetical protein